MSKIAVVILTYNEALHLGRCLASIAPLEAETFVVDSFSSDETLEIARAAGVKILQHAFRNQADQFQWALDAIETDADWIFRLDADETIEASLAQHLALRLGALPEDVVGVTLDRKHIFMGRWIRHGGRYPLTLLRIFRRGHGRSEQRWMDEHILVAGGRTVHFSGGFADHNLNDLSYFTEKHNKYATREALAVVLQAISLDKSDKLQSGTLSKQAATKRWIKTHIYNKLPFALTSFSYFLYRYVVLLGFLDGKEGLIYHFLQGGWYRFLVGAKLVELERGIAGLTERDAILEKLEALTGLRVR